ncbi:M50 family metallopeptidase [Candidatus Poribacteria bacterium]|nr:M50 family metallopeptidase [Candidatus Poribacteria bacterium]
MIKEFFKRLDIRVIVIFVVVGLLWDTPVVYPLKIFVVFMHELSHGIAAMMTGGQIKEIVVVSQQGGHTLTMGGSRFWTLTAGYLGSLVWGGLILVLAARTHLDKLFSTLIGIGMVFVSIFYVRNMFGLIFGIAFGGGLIVIGWLLSESINDLILRVIGLTSCLYAILDIKSDILDRAYLRSDARMLSELTHIPTVIWGFLWIIIAIIGTLFFLYVAGKGKAKLDKPVPSEPV